ncbi:hypothetical protein SI65_04875 [Aspergillus cristatus]|uniref:Vacuolar sorting protein Vps3844 C-terminal domain-containing protein n=1 Tax=Aspergillus cristatus TaxID=573508 RepID=A0A1E3BG34_ASPCR|nr:hypothetical protein SI65_04875 [Aspergillus cristatus]
MAVQRLLELRIAPPDMSTLGRIDQETVKFLNHFGGTPSPLFGVSLTPENGKTTIILEGIAPEVGSSVKAEYTDINVIPHSSSIETSLGSLLKMKTSDSAEPKERHCSFYASNKGTELYEALKCLLDTRVSQDILEGLEKGLLEHADMLESWVDTTRSETLLRLVLKPVNTTSDSVDVTDSLKSLFRHISAVSSEVTALLLSRPTKPTESNENLQTRSLANKGSSAKLVNSRFEQQDPIPVALSPICYASESSCSESTNNCSGHGHCYRKSGSGETTVNDCYACKCQATTVRKQDGTIQKVQWGGSACQRRDISSPFFLIAGVTVIGVLAISTAIGLLFQVGQAELPSVISAGVSGTRIQK